MIKVEKLVLGPMQTNCYIVFDQVSNEAAVFDPACYGNIILAKIKELGLELKYIIITHAHADHIEALDELKLKTKALICIGTNDFDALNDSQMSLCCHFGQDAPKSVADTRLKDNDILYLGDEKLLFLETPGHTKGGICAFFDGGLISGDTLFFESVGRSDFPGGSMSELVRSIRDKLFLLPDETVVYPGHGDATTIGHEKRCNPWVM